MPDKHDRDYHAAHRKLGEATVEIERLRAALGFISATPYSMVNDSESLRHSCRLMCKAAGDALAGKEIA